MNEIQIAINPEIMSIRELRKYLESRLTGEDIDITLQIKKSPIRLRGMDPTILVAIIGVLGAGIGSLFTGLLQIAQKSKDRKIIIQGKDGQRIEVPADIALEKIDQLIERLDKISDETIKVIIF